MSLPSYSFCLMVVVVAVFLLLYFFFVFASRRGQKPRFQHTKFPSHEITYTEREYNNACGVDFGQMLYTISVNSEYLRESNFHRPLHFWIVVHHSGTYSVFIECRTYQNIFRNDIFSTDLHLYSVRIGTHGEHNLY